MESSRKPRDAARAGEHSGGGQRSGWSVGAFLGGVVGGTIGGVATFLATSTLAINQPLIAATSVANDTIQFRTPPAALLWTFDLQPKKHWAWSATRTVDAFVHVQVRPTSSGAPAGVDWHKYYGVRFWIQASTGRLVISEVNLFAGPRFVQYMFQGGGQIRVGTGWQEITMPFRRFALAPWEGRPTTIGPLALSDVTAFGFDEKTSSARVAARVWLDDIRLIGRDGAETLLSDGTRREFTFEGRLFTWIADTRVLG